MNLKELWKELNLSSLLKEEQRAIETGHESQSSKSSVKKDTDRSSHELEEIKSKFKQRLQNNIEASQTTNENLSNTKQGSHRSHPSLANSHQIHTQLNVHEVPHAKIIAKKKGNKVSMALIHC